MKGAFFHDHRFPICEGVYYYSSGFDKTFFQRYLSIFDSFVVIGRRRDITVEDASRLHRVDEQADFLLFENAMQATRRDSKKLIEDAIHCADFCIVRLPSVIGTVALPIIKKFMKPYLVEMVGCVWDSLFYGKGIKRKIAAFPMMLKTRSQVAQAPYVVYVTKAFLQKRYPTKGQSIPCSNVMLPEVLESVLQDRLVRIRQRVERQFIIGTTSTLDIHYKGQQYMIKALAKLRKEGFDILYELVGDGDTSFLQAEAKRFGVEAYVKFIGRLPHNEVFLWLDHIDLYVHPSLQEGLPRAIIEAMSRGCPVVAANSGGIAELIENQYIVRKKSVEDLVETIRGLRNDRLYDMAQRNHNRAKEYHTAVLAERRNRFFKDAIGGD